jgi:drug/metabolite transporter (DMT)-like permease
MWNSLVIVLSVLFLGNIKTDNKWLGIVLISFVGLIWAIGFGILTTKSFNVQIEKKIEVVEKI